MALRRLHEYGWKDWRRLRPVTHGYKAATRRIGDRLYQQRPPRDEAAFRQFLARLDRRPLAITIAFNKAWILGWQQRFIRRNVADAQSVVCDNSSDDGAAAEIARLCASLDVPYLRLPPNPFRRLGPAEMSHGVAMNWIHHRIVRAARPPVFAFLDHDLVPLAPVRLGDLVAARPVYGKREERAHGRWYLWAGFCVFDGAAIGDRPLDFLMDGAHELSTGGRNWWALYRHLDRASLSFAATAMDTFERIDGWVHIGNGGERFPWPDQFRAMVIAFLEKTWAGTQA